MTAKHRKCISWRKAIELTRRPDVRMIKQQTALGTDYYVVPGGLVEPETAKRIMEHPQIAAGKDGLFPGHDQTWNTSTIPLRASPLSTTPRPISSASSSSSTAIATA